MGRQKAFDRQGVLGKALDVFWLRGYAGTSIDHLTGAMGLGRASLYNEFGDKHALFLLALDGYCTGRQTELRAVLDTAPSVRLGIARILRGTIEALWSDPGQRGCLLVNSTAELAASDPAVAQRAAAASSVSRASSARRSNAANAAARSRQAWMHGPRRTTWPTR